MDATDSATCKIVKMSKSYPLAKLSEWDKNPRINEHAVEAVSRSVSAFGGISPIIADKDGRICAGHTRYKAALEIGLKTFPVILVDFGSEQSFKAYNVADNQTSNIAEWDDLALSDLVIDLDDSGFDLSTLGFEDDQLSEILNGPEPELDNPVDADPDDNAPAITRAGDLWQLGDHWLLCGDATKEADVSELMGGQKADMVFTDPPYNIDYGNIKHPKVKERDIVNDDMTADQYRSFCKAFAELLISSCRGCLYVCHAPGPDGRILASVMDSLAHNSTTIIWNKDVFTLGRGKYQNKYEPIWFGWYRQGGKRFTEDRTLTNVWDFDRPKASPLHPTMKPVALISQAIRHSTKPADIVLDTFLGCGTTIIACENLNRRCFAMEIEPHYCDVSVKRWEDATGKKAERYPAGEPRQRQAG